MLGDQRGVTYLMVMAAVVLMGVAMTVVGQQWAVVVKRDREAELQFRGTRIKTAIEAYAADYEVMKTRRANRYPLNLEQLTQKNPKRYLPVVYKDPITGQDFDLIKVGAEIQGIKSRSQERPLNQVQFKNAVSYNTVIFQAASPGAQLGGPTPNPLNPLLLQPPPVPGPPAAPSAPTP
jgi:type II secretory pathway pseudopilin PulG